MTPRLRWGRSRRSAGARVVRGGERHVRDLLERAQPVLAVLQLDEVQQLAPGAPGTGARRGAGSPDARAAGRSAHSACAARAAASARSTSSGPERGSVASGRPSSGETTSCSPAVPVTMLASAATRAGSMSGRARDVVVTHTSARMVSHCTRANEPPCHSRAPQESNSRDSRRPSPNHPRHMVVVRVWRAKTRTTTICVAWGVGDGRSRVRWCRRAATSSTVTQSRLADVQRSTARAASLPHRASGAHSMLRAANALDEKASAAGPTCVPRPA